MIIKKFQASTEQEAIMLAKEELGSSAVVVNIKATKYRGLRRMFKKDFVEVTAALEENQGSGPNAATASYRAASEFITPEEKQPDPIEERLDTLQNMLESKIQEIMESDKHQAQAEVERKEKEKEKEKNGNMAFLTLIYDQMLKNEVDEKYANQIIGEIEASLKKESVIDNILACIYQKIILKLGTPKEIVVEEGYSNIAFFVGPTGVGKTTTIAKIASIFKLEKKKKVAMITSDTYRIAAVEQLRTYASILDIPLQVVYTIEELNSAIQIYREYDLVLVDSAGRSHKNQEQRRDMLHLINDCNIPEGVKKDVFLVLSAATKYRDLQNIVDTYADLGDYRLLFTKLDETETLGNILNIRLRTSSDLSYVTGGQTVPDDISLIDPQKMAKNILGGGY